MNFVVGIDEVGRGPIAGPVVVCACAILEGVDVVNYFPKRKLKDSKALTPLLRKKILDKIKKLEDEQKIFFGVGEVDNKHIDEHGISHAIKAALQSALDKLHHQGIPHNIFIHLDGALKAPALYEQETIIKGDEKIPAISLASIYAKEYRDAKMREYSKLFPVYKFENHVGYGTKYHYEAIREHGHSELHRVTFLHLDQN